MEVWEKINYLLDENKISKKEFVNKLLGLEPKLKQTGEVPSVQTIYRYLNNQREIKIELIPYIAETLQVSEQELFNYELEYTNNYNKRYSKDAREILDLLQYAPNGIIEHIKNVLYKFKVMYKDSISEIT